MTTTVHNEIDIQTITRNLAPYIPGGAYRPPGDSNDRFEMQCGEISLSTGGALHVFVSHRVWGQLRIIGAWPRTRDQHPVLYIPDYGEPKPTLEIRVLATRPAVYIARYICHRMLWDYQRCYAAAVEHRNRLDAAADQGWTDIHALAEAAKLNQPDIDGVTVYSDGMGRPYCKADLQFGGNVQMYLRNVPVPTAKMILELITKSSDTNQDPSSFAGTVPLERQT